MNSGKIKEKSGGVKMKRFLAILLGVVSLGFLLVGCTTDPIYDSQVWEQSQPGVLPKMGHTKANLLTGILLRPVKETYYTSEKGLTFQIENKYPQALEYYHHQDLSLEIQQGDGWYQLPQPSYSPEPLFVIPEKSQNEIRIFLQDWDYDFPSGHYRLVLYPQNVRERAWTAAEFDLVQDTTEIVNRTRVPVSLKTDPYPFELENEWNSITFSATTSTYSRKELLSKGEITFEMTNSSDEDFTYGNKYLSVEIDDQWYTISPKEGEINLSANGISAHRTTTDSIILKDWNYDFPLGHYRCAYIEYQSNPEESRWVAMEFDVVE